MERVVVAECTGCGHKRDVRADEVKSGEVPICEKCISPMIAVRAELREDFLQ